jgi:hypothetical protein
MYTQIYKIKLTTMKLYEYVSFIIQTETESSLTESNRAEFTSGRAHLTPIFVTHAACFGMVQT